MPSSSRVRAICCSGVFAKGRWAAFVIACMIWGSYNLLPRASVETRAVDELHQEPPNVIEARSQSPPPPTAARLRAAPDALKENTKVSVYLVKELGTPPNARVMLFVRSDDNGGTGVVSTLSQSGENAKSAALRALAAHAGVLPVPDLDFIVNAGTATGDHVIFVALIREARLLLKGRQPADGKWVVFKEAPLSDGLSEATVRPPPSLLCIH